VEDFKEQVIIKGPLYKRNRMFAGFVPPKRNEVITPPTIIGLTVANTKPIGRKLNEVSMFSLHEERPLDMVKRKRMLLQTNASFPAHRDTLVDEHSGRLICRWKFEFNERNINSRKLEASIRRILQHEADEDYAVEDSILRTEWRTSGQQDVHEIRRKLKERNKDLEILGPDDPAIRELFPSEAEIRDRLIGKQ
jgi:hypothetical protein